MERWNNYDRAARQAEQLFLSYDQEALIRAFSLDADGSYLYVRFVARPYRIGRQSGAVERGPDWSRAGFEEVLSIFDALCHGEQPPAPRGAWVQTGSLRGMAAGPASINQPESAARLARSLALLPAACRALDGDVTGGGDSGGDFNCEFPIIAGISARLRLWLPDDEFPAQVQFRWNMNVLDFLHYETLFYIQIHLLRRLEEELARLENR